MLSGAIGPDASLPRQAPNRVADALNLLRHVPKPCTDSYLPLDRYSNRPPDLTDFAILRIIKGDDLAENQGTSVSGG
jgi:hypothetical protein